MLPMNTKVTLLVLGVWFLTLGTLLVITSREPGRNSLTSAIYALRTSPPWPRSVKGEIRVLIHGIVCLIAAVALLARLMFLLIVQ
jgi:hypothetical protein